MAKKFGGQTKLVERLLPSDSEYIFPSPTSNLQVGINCHLQGDYVMVGRFWNSYTGQAVGYNWDNTLN
jgi:hypothetical protein